MDSDQCLSSSSSSSSLNCELNIIRARNTDMIKSAGEIFVRCYLYAGNNRRVRLDTKQISSKSDPIWNQTFSFDCSGTEESINQLKNGKIVFQLRCRNTNSLFGRISGSKLLGSAEIPWENIFESRDLEIEKWIVMIPKNGQVYEDFKPPAVQIAIRIHQQSAVEVERKLIANERRGEECGCVDCKCNCFVDYDLFAIGAALEVAL